MKYNHLVLAFATASLLGACATKPYIPTLYDASTAQVRSIAIADDAIQEKLGANELSSNMGTGQAAGGLIGLLVVAAIEGAETSSRKKALNELMAPTGYDAEAEFEKMLSAKLEAAGFADISMVGGERKKRKALEAFPSTTADAILDVSMTNFGMQKAKTGQEWRPTAGVNVQLVSAADSTVLMENIISYNNAPLAGTPAEGIITLAPAMDSVGFMKIKEMDAEVVAGELTNMLDEITDTIVSLLQ